MILRVAALLSLRGIFDDDTSFIAFNEEFVCSALASLVVAVGKDILWKPLNHKILLLMRDRRRAVRIVALKALQRLFTEV